MTNDTTSDEDPTGEAQSGLALNDIDRRTLLASTGTLVGGLALAGCTGGGGDTDTPTEEETATEEATDTEAPTDTESEEGGAATSAIDTTSEGDMGGSGNESDEEMTSEGDMTTEGDMGGSGNESGEEMTSESDMTTEGDMGGSGNESGNESGNATGDGGAGDGETTNVAIISSSAGFGDRAFNDLAIDGLETAAEDYNVEIQQVEETNQSNYGTVQSRLAESSDPDYDLIVLVGFQHTQALETNATQYPDQRWMLINANVEQPNVAGYAWANHEMSFQAGVLAGTMTTRDFSFEDSSTDPDTATVGFVGGADGALIKAFERSYKAGVAYVNEDVEVRAGYVGNFEDTQTANDIASSQYDAGADIVYHAAAAAGQGVFPAAQDAGRFAIGVDADQSVTLSDFEDVIMGSAVKRINRGTYQVTEAIVQDNWESVQGNNILGLEQDAVAVVLGNTIGPELPDVVEQNLDESKQAILDGDVEVPCTASGCQG